MKKIVEDFDQRVRWEALLQKLLSICPQEESRRWSRRYDAVIHIWITSGLEGSTVDVLPAFMLTPALYASIVLFFATAWLVGTNDEREHWSAYMIDNKLFRHVYDISLKFLTSVMHSELVVPICRWRASYSRGSCYFPPYWLDGMHCTVYGPCQWRHYCKLAGYSVHVSLFGCTFL